MFTEKPAIQCDTCKDTVNNQKYSCSGCRDTVCVRCLEDHSRTHEVVTLTGDISGVTEEGIDEPTKDTQVPS